MGKMKINRIITGLLLTGLLAFPFQLTAQNLTDISINEVLLNNQNNYVDAYGNRSAWIEIMNRGYSTINLGGCYLTNNPENPRMYRIPTIDPATRIPQRQFITFFADGLGTRGTLHLNFRLDSNNRFIALYAPDGETLIDSVTVPMMKADQSYSRIPDGSNNWQITANTTPNAFNAFNTGKGSSTEKFKKFDPYGLIMAVTAMMVVFTALLFLYRIFRFTGSIIQKPIRIKRLIRRRGEEPEEEIEEIEEVSGEVFAAISAALYFYQSEQHDQESTILTIEKVSRRYSPWSSKLYGLTQPPVRIVRHNPIGPGKKGK